MDQLNGMASGAATGISKNFIVLKEPRGMIKILQLFMCILAFTTTTGYDSGFTVTFNDCVNAKEIKEGKTERMYHFKWSYPFRVAEENKFEPSPCNPVKQELKSLIWGDYSTSSQFFVAIGVITMLYSIAMLIVYIFFDPQYRQNPRIPQCDFLVSCALTCFWLLSAAAWSSGVSDLKFYTEPSRIMKDIDYCRDNVTRKINPANCDVDDDDYPDYAALNVSLIAGFTCFAVWAGGLWFLFKETPYAASVLPSMQNPWDTVQTNVAGNTAAYGMPGGPIVGAPATSYPFTPGAPANGQFEGRYASPAVPFAGAAINAPTNYTAQANMGGYMPPGQATTYAQSAASAQGPRM